MSTSADTLNVAMSHLQLTVLPYRLVSSKISKDKVPNCSHTLMHMIFFPRRRARFFSYVDDEDEVSLVCDESWIKEFPADAIDASEEFYRAIQVGLGATGFDPAMLNTVTSPLAAAGIHVLYISSFSSDYILIRDEKLDDALTILRRTQQFRVVLDDSTQDRAAVQSSDSSSPVDPRLSLDSM